MMKGFLLLKISPAHEVARSGCQFELQKEADIKIENIYVIFIQVRHYDKTISSVLVMQSPMHCLLNCESNLCVMSVVNFGVISPSFPIYFSKFTLALLSQRLPVFCKVRQAAVWLQMAHGDHHPGVLRQQMWLRSVRESLLYLIMLWIAYCHIDVSQFSWNWV